MDAVKSAYLKSMCTYANRKKERERRGFRGDGNEPSLVEDIGPEEAKDVGLLRDWGLPDTPVLDEMEDEDVLACRQAAASILEAELARQWELPADRAERVAQQREALQRDLPPEHVSRSWSKSLVTRETVSKRMMDRCVKFSRPYYGQDFVHEPGRCKTCGRHTDRAECRYTGGCRYPLCLSPSHDIGICEVLHGTCHHCSFKGIRSCPDFQVSPKYLFNKFFFRTYSKHGVPGPHVAESPGPDVLGVRGGGQVDQDEARQAGQRLPLLH